MLLAGTYWEWGSGENCIEPSDALFIQGVQGLEIVFTEREQANMAGALAASKGYTAGNDFYSQLNLTTYANGTETSQIVSMVGPKTLSNGEEINTTVFIPIRTFSLDPEVKKFTLTIDHFDQVSETNEQNVYELSFRMCWPADLTPGTAMYLLGQPGHDPLEVHRPSREARNRSARSNMSMSLHREEPAELAPVDVWTGALWQRAVHYAGVFAIGKGLERRGHVLHVYVQRDKSGSGIHWRLVQSASLELGSALLPGSAPQLTHSSPLLSGFLDAGDGVR
jgi:hypothetical protein